MAERGLGGVWRGSWGVGTLQVRPIARDRVLLEDWGGVLEGPEDSRRSLGSGSRSVAGAPVLPKELRARERS